MKEKLIEKNIKAVWSTISLDDIKSLHDSIPIRIYGIISKVET